MRELVAKKYVKALIKGCSDAELAILSGALNELSSAYSVDKFQTIIQSPDVNGEKKEEFVLSMIESPDNKLTNLIKLLGSNDRLGLIPSIASELVYQISLKNNQFEGEVVGSFEITDAQLAQLEESFGKKFGATIKLTSQKTDFPGIKIQLDDLGVEVSFSVERLKAQMAEHILKAI